MGRMKYTTLLLMLMLIVGCHPWNSNPAWAVYPDEPDTNAPGFFRENAGIKPKTEVCGMVGADVSSDWLPTVPDSATVNNVARLSGELIAMVAANVAHRRRVHGGRWGTGCASCRTGELMEIEKLKEIERALRRR